MEHKSKKENYVTLGGRLFYLLAGGILCILTRLLLHADLTVDDKVRSWKKSKSGYVILSAHPSEADAAILAMAVYPRFTRFVVGTQQLYKGFQGWLLRSLQVIPRRQFTSDVTSIKEMIKTIRRGDALAMMPEGRVSLDGTQSPIDPSTVKLLKKLGAPVAILIPHGTYFVKPSYNWAPIITGKCSGSLYCLFDEEEVKNMSAEEMMDRINKEFVYNASEDLKGTGITFGKEGKPAMEKVSHLFYRCPNCGALYTVNDDGYHVKCSSCGVELQTTREMFFKNESGTQMPLSIPDWNKTQIAFEKEFWQAEDAKLSFTAEKYMMVLKQDMDFSYKCGGILSLDKEGLHYVDDEEEINVPLVLLPGISCDYLNGMIAYYEGDKIRRFLLESPHYATRFVNSLMVLKGYY